MDRSDSMLLEDIDRNLNQVQDQIFDLNQGIQFAENLLGDAQTDVGVRSKELDQIADFAQGEKANNYITQSIDEAQEVFRVLSQQLDCARLEAASQIEHLNRQIEFLGEDKLRIEKSQDRSGESY